MRSTLTRRSLPARTGAAAFAAFATVGLAACGGDTAGTEAGADVEDIVEEEPAADEPAAEEPADEPAAEEPAAEGPFEGPFDSAFYDEIDSYVGQEVVLSADVNEVITPTAFTIAGTDDTSVEALLVVSATENNELAPETTVEVTGTVQQAFVVTEVEEELGIDLDDALFADYEQEPYVVAESVEVLENVDSVD
ncbi:hypothetical protein E4P41_03200 [Geodermatophilus sp. DF01-2]|uniref:hypothetical protein n=1 Tax=Geodermatophilus sp. DF01-2 TaxID=2559610 RepID=UPI001073E4E4|nr:hypothetical protein [Geodermatophilus sp. DF01_2]TFV63982.1 hypothetical protein E4P41_03200 [Geodermatophilus sp. DF01_2]